jgi:tetratricopeptide (TPR) repeat protein/predicted Ser/Thr protein kinase
VSKDGTLASDRGGDRTIPATRASGRSRAEAEPELEAGSTIGRYVILERIGRGGMGVVFSAFDPQLDRRVAIKILLHGVRSADDETRLFREARALARLAHPNVVVAHDVGMAGDHVFIAMEFVRGQTLQQWNAQPRDWRQVVDVILQAARGLEAAHAAGVVHGDFKPSNVLVDDDGRARVLDFGLARPDPDSSHAARWGLDDEVSEEIEGTPAYMAPEQFAEGEVGPAADQYALCVTMYELLTGESPFELGTWLEIAAGATTRQLPKCGLDKVPRSVARVLARGLSTDPADRYPHLGKLIEDLRRCLAPPRWKRSLAVVGAGVVLAAGAVLAIDSDERCTGSRAEAEGVWNDLRRDAVVESFKRAAPERAGVESKAAVERIDQYIDAWVLERTESCEAAQVRREISEERMDARMACLDGRLAALSRLVDSFEVADRRRVEEAVEVLAWLENPETCSWARETLGQPSLPDDEAERARMLGWIAVIDNARLHQLAGHPRRALDLLDSIASDVLASDQPSIKARLLQGRGDVVYDLGDYERAVRDSEAAFDEAIVAGDDLVAYQMATSLVYVLGTNVDGEERARWWLARAKAFEHRLPVEFDQQIALMSNHAVMAATHGHIEEAIAKFEEASEAARRSHNVEQYGTLMVNLAAAHANSDGMDTAHEVLQEGLDVMRRWGIDETPAAIPLRKNLAVTRVSRQQYALGLQELDDLDRFAAQVGEPSALHGGSTEQARGMALMHVGDLDGAISAFERSEVWFGARQGYRSRNAVIGTIAKLRALWHAGRLDEAIDQGTVALERCSDAAQCRRVHVWLGWVYLERGQPDKALEHGQAVVALADEDPAGSRNTASMAQSLIGHAALDLDDVPLAETAALEAELEAGRPEDTSSLTRAELNFLQARLQRLEDPQGVPPGLGPALGYAVAGGSSATATKRRIEAWMGPRWGSTASQ